MNIKMHKEVMRRTCLRNKFIDSKTDADRIAYSKQHGYCVSRYKQQKKSMTVILMYVMWWKIKPFREK